MSQLPIPPSGAEAPRSKQNTRPRGFAEQRRKVVQLLKDFNHDVSTRRSSTTKERTDAVNIPKEEVSDGHWNMTPEGMRRMKDTLEAKSHRLVAEEVERLRLRNVNYSAAWRVFFDDTVADSEYDRLNRLADEDQAKLDGTIKDLRKKNASKENLIRAWIEGQTDRIKLRTRLNLFIDDLTLSLMDYELFAVFAEDPKAKATLIPKTERRQGAEEKYERIYAVFSGWCEHLKKTKKRYRNKAYEQTMVACDEPRSTVERAVVFMESDGGSKKGAA